MSAPGSAVSADEAAKAVGFFPWLFGVLAGTPPIITLYQAVFVEHRLSAFPQSIIDDYNRLLAEMGEWFEPFLLPVLSWLEGLFGLPLTLYPHWRPLFVLCMVLVVAVGRFDWRQEDYFRVFIQGGFNSTFALGGAVLAATIALEAPIWMQFGAGVVAIGLPQIGLELVDWSIDRIFGNPASLFAGNFLFRLYSGFGVAAAAALGIYFVNGLDAGLAILLTGCFILFNAVVAILFGNSGATIIGLTMLGGFLGAGAVYAADWAFAA